MSDATKRKCGCDWSLWETCDECNPDDEAAEIRRLRTRLAESEAEVGNQRRLRMLAEEAIPKGTEVARDYFAAEAEALLNRARAETDLVRQGLDLERTARLAAEAEAEKWRSEARRALAAEAERDDLLGALRGLEVSVQAMFDAIDDPDYKSWPGVREDQLRQAADRARAAIASAERRSP